MHYIIAFIILNINNTINLRNYYLQFYFLQ